MAQFFTVYFPKYCFLPQNDFSLSFKKLPFSFHIAKNGNVYVDKMHFNEAIYSNDDLQTWRESGLQNGITVISINGQKLSDMHQIDQNILENMISNAFEKEIWIRFSEELKPIDHSLPIGFTWNTTSKFNKQEEEIKHQTTKPQNTNIHHLSFMISASSYSPSHEPSQCRLNNPQSYWKPCKDDEILRNVWISFDLEEKRPITKICIQGSLDHTEYVESLWIDYSHDGCKWYNHPAKKIKCKYNSLANNKNSTATLKLWPTIHAQFIRIRPYKWVKHSAMRVELYGTTKYRPQFGRIIKVNDGKNGLIMQTSKAIKTKKAMQVDCKAVVHAALDRAEVVAYATFLASDQRNYTCTFTTPNAHASER